MWKITGKNKSNIWFEEFCFSCWYWYKKPCYLFFNYFFLNSHFAINIVAMFYKHIIMFCRYIPKGRSRVHCGRWWWSSPLYGLHETCPAGRCDSVSSFETKYVSILSIWLSFCFSFYCIHTSKLLNLSNRRLCTYFLYYSLVFLFDDFRFVQSRPLLANCFF